VGFKDQMKKAASTVGAGASKAGRLTQAQVKLTSLKSDVGSAEKELGQAAFELNERGELQAPSLEVQIENVRQAKAAVAAKEEEIEAIKAEGDESKSDESGA